MPITIGCLDKMGIDQRVTRFVIPVGKLVHSWLVDLDSPLTFLVIIFQEQLSTWTVQRFT